MTTEIYRGPAIRLIFMGSPDFALPSLERLLEAGHEIALVVSQPDRPAGRRQQLRPPPVAQAARAHQLPLFQPQTLKTPEAVGRLRLVGAEAIVVAAFGLYLPLRVLQAAQRGAVNVHPSLLPRHRGPAPIQAAIIVGDEQTGVTIMEISTRMDAGPIIAQRATPILPRDDTPALEHRLAHLGADLLVEVLEPWANDKLTPQPQDENQATYTPRITREDALLDWRETATVLWRKVRAYRGWPEAYTRWDGRTLKILEAEPLAGSQGLPGQVFTSRPEAVGPAWPAVVAGENALLLRTLVLEGRRPTTGEAFLRGYPGFVGARLG